MASEKNNKIRVEIILTEADSDIIEMIEDSGMQRATFFKRLARDYYVQKQTTNADIEKIIKKAVDEAVKAVTSQMQPIAAPNEVPQSKPSNKIKERLAFGIKRG